MVGLVNRRCPELAKTGGETVGVGADGDGVELGVERVGEVAAEGERFKRGRGERAAVVLDDHEHGHVSPNVSRTSTTAGAAAAPSPSRTRWDSTSGGASSVTIVGPPASPIAANKSTAAFRDVRRPFMVG